MPLKMHTAPQGYECYMTCAIKGDPTPHITWLRNSLSLNTNTNYYISNTCGVCSLLILRVGPKDSGEYKIVAENPLGRAECSTKLTVRGELHTNSSLFFSILSKFSIHSLFLFFQNKQWQLKNGCKQDYYLDKNDAFSQSCLVWQLIFSLPSSPTLFKKCYSSL